MTVMVIHSCGALSEFLASSEPFSPLENEVTVLPTQGCDKAQVR